jgi:nitrite reductase/ring-hydroxylating ferredoxin subunit
MCEKDGFSPVFDEKDLQGDAMVELLVQEVPILLIRKKGEIFAISGQCPHLGGPLAGGWDGCYIVGCTRGCAGFTFDIRTGKMVAYPDSGINLKKYECKIKDGKILVKLA